MMRACLRGGCRARIPLSRTLDGRDDWRTRILQEMSDTPRTWHTAIRAAVPLTQRDESMTPSNDDSDALTGLLAREAIRDLPLKYCDCVWRDDIAGLVALFDTEGTFTAITSSREITVSGHEALLDFFANATDFMPRPYIHNHVVELTSTDAATGRCYLDLRSAKNNMEWLGAGYYEDEYVRRAGSWLFHSRRFHVVRMDELPKGMD